jgi:hypothetical protein
VFIGHYGVSLAAKRWAPRVSLGWLFLAVQGLDLLFASFVLAGVEKLAIVPGFTAYNPYDLISMPYSHGLVAALGWSALVAVLVRALLGPSGGRAAAVLGAAVFSHWVLDLPMHTRDLPLLGDHSQKVGLGLWRHRDLSLAAEAAVLAAGVAVWLPATGGLGRARIATVSFLVLLAVVLLSTPFMPPPASPNAFAVTALVGYLALAGAAAWVDARRARSLSR